jgi:hypothetical protein
MPTPLTPPTLERVLQGLHDSEIRCGIQNEPPAGGITAWIDYGSQTEKATFYGTIVGDRQVWPAARQLGSEPRLPLSFQIKQRPNTAVEAFFAVRQFPVLKGRHPRALALLEGCGDILLTPLAGLPRTNDPIGRDVATAT